MNLTIEGGNAHRRSIVREMVPWLAWKLMPRTCKDLDITVTIYALLKEEKLEAVVSPDPDYVKSPSPRCFIMGVDKSLTAVNFRLSLCHELVHIKQFVTRQIYHYEDGTTRWKGKLYPEGIADGLTYWEVPWEEEARGKEHGLFQLFLAHKKNLRKNR